MSKKTTENDLYEVEAIVAEKVIHTPKKSGDVSAFSIYKVRWKGYKKEQDTWEPEGHLMGCEQLLKEWRARNPIRKSKRKTDFMEIDSETPGSAGSGNEKASKIARTRPRHQPGTAVYARYRKNLSPEADLENMHPDRKQFLEKLQKIPGPPVVLYNDVDDDPSPPVSFQFVERYRILSLDVVDYVKVNSDFWAGCSCEGPCKANCSCLEENGISYNKRGRVIWEHNSASINECNERCGCDIDCPNRVVQRGRKIPLEIFKTEDKGWGLRSPERIPKGTFIDTYPGELITVAEANERAEKYAGTSYLFDLDKFSKVRRADDDEEMIGSQTVEILDANDIYVIDGKNFGGVTRFINHSCDPNLLIYAVTRERADYRLYDLAMFANADIPAYEELTFSYVGVEDAAPEPGTTTYPCHCGSVHCKGYLW